MSRATDDVAFPGPGVAIPVAAIARPTLAVVLLTCVGGFLVSLDVSVANALLPAIGATFRTTDRAVLAWIITAYAIVFAAALVPAGQLADRLDRRQVYLAGLAALAVGFRVVLPGREPSATRSGSGRTRRRGGRGLARIDGTATRRGRRRKSVEQRRPLDRPRWLGICAGPILGGPLTTVAGWRWVFLANLPLIAAMCAGRRALPDTPRVPSKPFDAVEDEN